MNAHVHGTRTRVLEGGGADRVGTDRHARSGPRRGGCAHFVRGRRPPRGRLIRTRVVGARRLGRGQHPGLARGGRLLLPASSRDAPRARTRQAGPSRGTSAAAERRPVPLGLEACRRRRLPRTPGFAPPLGPMDANLRGNARHLRRRAPTAVRTRRVHPGRRATLLADARRDPRSPIATGGDARPPAVPDPRRTLGDAYAEQPMSRLRRPPCPSGVSLVASAQGNGVSLQVPLSADDSYRRLAWAG